MIDTPSKYYCVASVFIASACTGVCCGASGWFRYFNAAAITFFL